MPAGMSKPRVSDPPPHQMAGRIVAIQSLRLKSRLSTWAKSGPHRPGSRIDGPRSDGGLPACPEGTRAPLRALCRSPLQCKRFRVSTPRCNSPVTRLQRRRLMLSTNTTKFCCARIALQGGDAWSCSRRSIPGAGGEWPGGGVLSRDFSTTANQEVLPCRTVA